MMAADPCPAERTAAGRNMGGCLIPSQAIGPPSLSLPGDAGNCAWDLFLQSKCSPTGLVY